MTTATEEPDVETLNRAVQMLYQMERVYQKEMDREEAPAWVRVLRQTAEKELQGNR